MNPSHLLRRVSLAMIFMAAMAELWGQAAWDGGAGTGAWGTANNWSPNSVPGTTTLTFDADTANSQFTIGLGGNRTATSLTFGSATPANGFTFNNNTLTVNTGGITNNDNMTQTFNSNVTVGGIQTWAATSGGLTFGSVTFSNNLTLSGASAIAINGTITTSNTRTLTNNNSSGAVTINNFTQGGTLTVAGTGATSITGALTIAANRTLTNNNTGGLTINNVNASSGNRRLTLNGSGTTTISGIVALNGGGITMNNASGTTILSGANTYTGGTIVTAGTLVAANDAALGTSANGTTIADGATLALQGDADLVNEALTSVRGTGVGTNGAIRNISGSNTIGGTVTYVDTTTIGSTAGTLTLSGTQTGTNRSLTFAGAGDIAVSGSITTGTGSLTKTGNGTLTLSNDNTFSGAVNITGGTLIASNADALGDSGSATTTTVNGGTLALQGGLTFDNESLILNGPGFSNTGAFRNISGNNTWSGTVSLATDSEIQSDAGTLTISNTVARSGTTNRALTIDGAGNTTISGAIASTITNLTKNGAGTLTLSNGSNAFTGTTDINAGTLMISGGADRITNTSAVTVGASGTLDLNGNNETVASISGSGNILLGGATLTSGTTTNTTFSGVISEAGAMTKQGTGTLTLSGANSYTGLTTVSAGTLNIQNATALGTSAAGTTVSSGATLALQGGITVTGEALTITGAGVDLDPGAGVINAGALRNVADTNTFNGSITLGGSATITSVGGTLNVGVTPLSETDTIAVGTNVLTVNTSGGNVDFRASLTGSGPGEVIKTGSGTLQLTGRSNTFSGTLYVNEGTLALATPTHLGTYLNEGIQGNVVVGDNVGTIGGSGEAIFIFQGGIPSNNRISDSVNFRINSDGVFNLNNRSDKIGSLTLQGGDVMTGSGTLDLGGNINFLTAARQSTISGLLGLSGVVRTIDVATGTSALISATINNGGYIKTGDGTLIVTANDASTYGGTTTVNGGVLNVRGNLALGQGDNNAYASRTEVDVGALELQNNVSIAAEYLQLGSTGIGGTGGGLRSVSGNNTWSGTIALDGTSRINTDSGSTLLLDGVTLSMGTFDLTVGGVGNTTISKDISSDNLTPGNLIKDGTGTLFLSGNNLYQGQTQVTNGIVNISSSDALGSTTGNTVVSGIATLQLQGDISTGEGISITGSGYSGTTGVIQNVSGNNTISGAVTLTGNSQIASDSGTLTLSGDVTGSGQALTVTGADNITISGAISSGVSGLTKNGDGTLLLSGVNGYTGTTQVNDGTLAFGATNAIGASNLVATATGAIVDLNGFNQSIGSISGTGTIDFGDAQLTLNGTSTFAGIFDGSGTLVLNAGSSLTLGANFNNSNLNIVLNGGSLLLNNTSNTFGSLTVTAGSILDFGAGASIAQFSSVTANATLTVNNWVNAVDYFYSTANAGVMGQSPLNNIVFNGFNGNQTTWQPNDSGPYNDNQIVPVPEPEVYGAAFVSGLLALVAWRRRKAANAKR